MKTIKQLLLAALLLGIVFRLFFGIFVVKPIGPFTQGSTTVYWRYGLEAPFISSPASLLQEGDKGLLGNGLQTAQIATEVQDRQVWKGAYSERLYQWAAPSEE